MSEMSKNSFEVQARKLLKIATKISSAKEKEEGLPRPPICELRHAAIMVLSAAISMVKIVLRKA